MRILICGSRDWIDAAIIERELRLFHVGPQDEVAHDDCQGAVKIAGKIARQLGVNVTAYPARWHEHDREGPDRCSVQLSAGREDVQSRRPSPQPCDAARNASRVPFVFDGSARQGFIHDGRLIYALEYWAEPPPRYAASQIIVHLSSDGNSENGHVYPLPPNTQLFTTKPGQEILLRGERKKVVSVKVWSEAKSLRNSVMK